LCLLEEREGRRGAHLHHAVVARHLHAHARRVEHYGNVGLVMVVHRTEHEHVLEQLRLLLGEVEVVDLAVDENVAAHVVGLAGCDARAHLYDIAVVLADSDGGYSGCVYLAA